MPELIDREATLKKMCETCGYCERFEMAMRSTHPDFVTDKCSSYKFLAEQPTIEAEPVRHGRWIHLEGWFNKSIVKCSACGNTLDMDGVNAGRGDANFCPNCGRDMRATDTNVGGKGGADNGFD